MNHQSITIKIGSNVLTSADGTLDENRMAHLVNQIADLHQSGRKVILVSSGAVAGGRSITKFKPTDPVSERQLLSSIGQVRLLNIYASLFEKHQMQIAQILVTKEDFRTREHYLNMKNCMNALWENNVIPIINENDAVSVTALMFTDNDELAGLMASMMDCETLCILSNVDGIYNGNPKDEGVEVIREITAQDSDLSNYIATTKSDFGRGGLLTKFKIAQKTAASGINVLIANGRTENILKKLVDGEPVVHTHFIAGEHSPAVKKWMAYSDGFTKAEVTINEGARKALTGNKASSLLLPGIVSMDGDFKKGDLLKIKDESGEIIGIGRSGYDKEKAIEHKNDIKYRPLIHYDYLFIYPSIINGHNK